MIQMSKQSGPVMITDKEFLDKLFNMTEHDMLKLSNFTEMFGSYNGKVKYHTYDMITVPPGVYGPEGKKNKNTFVTTIGKFWFNRVFIEGDLFNTFNGWVEDPVNDDMYGDLSKAISYDLMEDKIPLQALKDFLIKSQKFQPYANFLACGFSEKMLTISSKINAKKQELIKKNKAAIDAGDEKVVADIEKELLDYAKTLLEDDPSMNMYGSGARGSFGNNFKNIFVMKGASKNPDPTKGYDIITSNYIDGVSREDYVKVAKSLTEGPYARGKKTAKGGYYEKLFLRAYQHLVLLPEGTDCGTKRYIEVELTKKNSSMFMYNYVIEGSKLIELTKDEMNKRIGKTVKMRFSSMCEAPEGHFCHKCAGNAFYRLGIMNVGTATPQLMSRIKNISMKSFHNSQIKLHEIDVDAMFADTI